MPTSRPSGLSAKAIRARPPERCSGPERVPRPGPAGAPGARSGALSALAFGAAVAAAAAGALGAFPGSLAGQQLLTSRDALAWDWPEPTARIAYGADPLQYGHLRLPEGAGPHPVVIYMHGGCYLSAFDIRHAGLAEQGLADAGWAVWSIEYRRVGDPGGGWPSTFLDIAAGVEHLRVLAAEHPLDLGRVYAAGHSAGANMALWAAARADVPVESELHATDPLPIRGVLALAPAADLETLHAANVCGGVVDRLMGGSPSEQPDRWAATSPMRLVPRVPQKLVIGALDEGFGPAGRSYFEAARKAGADHVEMIVAPASGHFEMIVPTTDTWPLVLEALRDLAGR